MPIINRVGGGAGSAAFQFEIVNGRTQPAAPADNTIWVNTSAAISSWAFQAEQPTGKNGLLWIQTAAASVVSFDAVAEDNAIMLYPTGAKLYTGGAWTAVEAFLYRLGAWVQFASLFGLSSFSITGIEGQDYIKIDDGGGNWRIKFLTSQTVTAMDAGEIEVFLVGAGAGGGNGGSTSGKGGNGGETKTEAMTLEAGADYEVVIGAGGANGGSAGGSTSFGNVTAAGGSAANNISNATTAFGDDSDETVYGDAGVSGRYPAVAGAANTGNGGDGGFGNGTAKYNGEPGGSGIVIIRNKRG